MKFIPFIFLLFATTSYGQVLDGLIGASLSTDTMHVDTPRHFTIYESFPCKVYTAFEEIDCQCLFKSRYFDERGEYGSYGKVFVNATSPAGDVLNIKKESIIQIWITAYEYHVNPIRN